MAVIEHSSVEVSFQQLEKEIATDKLTAFRLTEVQITGDEDDMFRFVRSFRGHPQLTEISLSNVTCTASGVTLDHLLSTVLVSLPRIRVLRLDRMKFSSGTLSSFGYCPSLMELTLRRSHIKDEDARIIAVALSDSTSLETIDLTGNAELSDRANLLFIQALDKNKSLLHIQLDDVLAGGEHRLALAQKLSQRASQAA